MKKYDSRRDFDGQARLVLLASIAAGVGALSTLTADLLLHAIRFFTNLFFFQKLSTAFTSPAAHTLGAWVIAVPVLGGLIVGLIARYGSEAIRGHGIPEAIEAIMFKKSTMSPKVAVLKPLASGIAIGSGGPFGAEGPIIMTGGAVGSLIAQHFHLSAAERKALLVAGATAGMTAVFGTPIAAVLLAVELLLFELRPRSLAPVAVACAVAGFLRPLLIESGPLFPLHTAVLPPSALLSCLIAGVLSGALAWCLSTALYRVEDGFHKLPLHCMWWPALGGMMRAPVMAVVFAFELTHDVNALLPVLATATVAYGFTVITMHRSILTEKIARRGHHVYREYGIDPMERHSVAEVMTTSVDSIDADALIADVMHTHFHAQARHRMYPVLRDGALVGMLDRQGLNSKPDALRVSDLSGVNVPIVALADETCRALATRLAVHGIGRLPVVTDMETRRLIGIVSHSDLMKTALGLHAEELERQTVRKVRFLGRARADVG
ncbi:chloride channel protein [Duganella callida]|uniref:CBS domain-containing protein n=1 Tax=Duganella callida TaxID=2561932 RepID=A0A4Y9S6A4_9BURK|nr:chloride channel protein [Duganella callida]TFW15588.1 CBS domain-containing protein [Duganella callida]